MSTADKSFINIFNEYYPFDRYIIEEPKSIEPTFDDLFLTEVFVPKTEIKPLLYNGKFVCYTGVNKDEIYVKVKCKTEEFRIGYYDFEDHIRRSIINTVIEDFGEYEWECLYCQDEDTEYPELQNAINRQKALIEAKYNTKTLK